MRVLVNERTLGAIRQLIEIKSISRWLFTTPADFTEVERIAVEHRNEIRDDFAENTHRDILIAERVVILGDTITNATTHVDRMTDAEIAEDVEKLLAQLGVRS